MSLLLIWIKIRNKRNGGKNFVEKNATVTHKFAKLFRAILKKVVVLEVIHLF